jgi:ABC-type phosphate/phosphonate transport system ATPase subunit
MKGIQDVSDHSAGNEAHAVAFLGPTHAGKSTLLRALMGCDPFNTTEYAQPHLCETNLIGLSVKVDLP